MRTRARIGGCFAAAWRWPAAARSQPYPTYPGGARRASRAGPRVAICYNALVSTLDEVQAAAQKECPAEHDRRAVDTDWYLQYCPLLLPARGDLRVRAERNSMLYGDDRRLDAPCDRRHNLTVRLSI